MEQAWYKPGAVHRQIWVALSLQWKLVEFCGLGRGCKHCRHCRYIADILHIYCRHIAIDCRRLRQTAVENGGLWWKVSRECPMTLVDVGGYSRSLVDVGG